MNILVIGVNYLTDDMALNFVDKLSTAANGQTGVDVFMVDNSAEENREDFSKQLSDRLKGIEYIDAGINRGYFGGARYGLRKYLEKHPLPDWVIVSNVDVEFRDDNFFQRLIGCNRISDVGVIAPSIISNSDGRELNPEMMRRPNKTRMMFYRYLFASYYAVNMYGFASMAKHRASLNRENESVFGEGDHNQLQKECAEANWMKTIYAPHGSCIVFSRKYFEEGGSLAYPQFLFYEEIFIAESARRLNMKIVYCPCLKVLDFEHVSTGRYRSREIASYIASSAKYVKETYWV